MDGLKRAGLIEALEAHGYGRLPRLKRLGIARSTFYHWRKRYDEYGIRGVERGKPQARLIWNRLRQEESDTIIRTALEYPELSPRLVAVKVTDEKGFCVSESTVYRLLKARGLVRPRPKEEYPAAKKWSHNTTAPDQIWQSDATWFFVVGYGYYKAIPVMDDYSRKLLAVPVKADETSDSISDAVEKAREKAMSLGHRLEKPPLLLSDNGSGFVGDKLAKYLQVHGMRHIFGKPYHPQTQGKVERLNRKLKEKVCLIVHCSPEELQRALDKVMAEYNATPHEALKNVSPDDVYAGKQEEILRRRAELKLLTLKQRKQYNLNRPDKLQTSR
ncbi:MAG: DDE-type integrase/transposase/recombinase [bacterium]